MLECFPNRPVSYFMRPCDAYKLPPKNFLLSSYGQALDVGHAPSAIQYSTTEVLARGEAEMFPFDRSVGGVKSQRRIHRDVADRSTQIDFLRNPQKRRLQFAPCLFVRTPTSQATEKSVYVDFDVLIHCIEI